MPQPSPEVVPRQLKRVPAGFLGAAGVLGHTGLVKLCGWLCDNSHMATNLAISQDLLERAVELSGKKTKTAAVTLALKEFIARREQRRLLELFNTLDWDPTYDYKAERSRS